MAKQHWVVADCPDCGGWGCKPPSDTCPTCGGGGLVKYPADYWPIVADEIARPNPELDALFARSHEE